MGHICTLPHRSDADMYLPTFKKLDVFKILDSEFWIVIVLADQVWYSARPPPIAASVYVDSISPEQLAVAPSSLRVHPPGKISITFCLHEEILSVTQ